MAFVRVSRIFQNYRYTLLIIIASLGSMFGAYLWFLNYANRMPTAPVELQKSAQRVIESVHELLRGEDDAKLLDEILGPDGRVYYLFGPKSTHPDHRPGTYCVDIVRLPSRYHATIYQYRCAQLDELNCEIWIVHYAGPVRWYKRRLPEFRYYYGVTSSSVSAWSRRRIVFRSHPSFESFNSQPALNFDREPTGEISVKLPTSETVRFSRKNKED